MYVADDLLSFVRTPAAHVATEDPLEVRVVSLADAGVIVGRDMRPSPLDDVALPNPSPSVLLLRTSSGVMPNETVTVGISVWVHSKQAGSRSLMDAEEGSVDLCCLDDDEYRKLDGDTCGTCVFCFSCIVEVFDLDGNQLDGAGCDGVGCRTVVTPVGSGVTQPYDWLFTDSELEPLEGHAVPDLVDEQGDVSYISCDEDLPYYASDGSVPKDHVLGSDPLGPSDQLSVDLFAEPGVSADWDYQPLKAPGVGVGDVGSDARDVGRHSGRSILSTGAPRQLVLRVHWWDHRLMVWTAVPGIEGSSYNATSGLVSCSVPARVLRQVPSGGYAAFVPLLVPVYGSVSPPAAGSPGTRDFPVSIESVFYFVFAVSVVLFAAVLRDLSMRVQPQGMPCNQWNPSDHLYGPSHHVSSKAGDCSRRYGTTSFKSCE